MPNPKWLSRTSWAFLAACPAFVPVMAQNPDSKDTPKAPATKAEAKTKAESKAEPKAAAQPAAKAEEKPKSAAAARVDVTETFRDPRVDDALNADLIKELPAPRPAFSPAEERQVKDMAAGRGDVTPRSINRFVEAKAAELTNKKAIETLLSGEGQVNTVVRPIETATTTMINVARASNSAGNTPFMSSYVAAMIKTFQPLLKAHLVTRVQALQAMAATGSIDLNPLFVSVLGDESQPWQVKMIALEGINNVIQGGKRPLGFNQRTQLTVAVLNMLREEKSPPWFLKAQAARLIGNLRIVSESVPERKVVPAETLLEFLTNAEERPEVRFESARALGLMDITTQFRPYNHLLVTTALAEAVVQTSQQVGTITPSDSSRAQQLVAIMADKVSPAFLGIQGLLDSGILRQAEVTQADNAMRSSINELFVKIKDVVNSGAAYSRARGDLVQARRADLQSRTVELQKVIDKVQPKDRTLVKGGKSFESSGAAPAQVAAGQ